MRSTPESGKSNKFLLPPPPSLSPSSLPLSLSLYPNPTAEKAPVMDLEVVGRHALLFDDDPMAAFVNSPAALVDWHSLSIDRYDVRHLLSAPPPPRKARRPPPPADSAMESELDRERYLDLPPPPTADEQVCRIECSKRQFLLSECQSHMQKLGQKQRMMVDIVLWHSHMEILMMPWIRRQQMLILDTVLHSQFRNICFRT